MSPTRKKSKDEEPRFEEAMDELTGLVDRLDAGDVPLEESLEVYERGVAAAREAGDEHALSELQAARAELS